MPGELIGGRYLVQRPVGRGGMGTVWLCTDQILRRDVAVKRMGALPGETSAGTARAMREARLAAAMNHRNAVSVYDVVDHDNVPWLVMEYFPSRTLGEIIREDGPLPPSRAGRIGAQVANALAAAHKLGIVHRDVKPGNILVGDGDHAKLSDFGIARAELDATLTQTGMMTGTPAYFAPELATGDGPSAASDVWALGATVYAAVEGEPPFGTHGNPLQVLARIAQQPVPRPNHAGSLLPALNEMLAKDPRARPTMAEAATRLEQQPNRAHVAPMAPPAATRLEHQPDRTQVAPLSPPAASAGQTYGRSAGRLVPIALGLLLVLAFAVGGWVLVSRGGGDGDPAVRPGQSEQTRRPTDNQPTQDETTEQAASDPVEFVEEYYALVPEDTDTGWTMLGGSLKAQGKDNYEDFWNGIEDVEVSNVTAESPTSVVYDVTYVQPDGTSHEHKRITLQQQGDSYLIVEDQPA